MDKTQTTTDELIKWCEEEAKASLIPPSSFTFHANFLRIRDALLRLKALEKNNSTFKRNGNY